MCRGGERRWDAEIDVGAQRVQRHAPSRYTPSGDFGAAKAARAVEFDAFRAQPHRDCTARFIARRNATRR